MLVKLSAFVIDQINNNVSTTYSDTDGFTLPPDGTVDKHKTIAEKLVAAAIGMLYTSVCSFTVIALSM